MILNMQRNQKLINVKLHLFVQVNGGYISGFRGLTIDNLKGGEEWSCRINVSIK